MIVVFVVYLQAHNNLLSVLDKAKINIIKSVGFGDDPEPAVAELQVECIWGTSLFN